MLPRAELLHQSFSRGSSCTLWNRDWRTVSCGQCFIQYNPDNKGILILIQYITKYVKHPTAEAEYESVFSFVHWEEKILTSQTHYSSNILSCFGIFPQKAASSLSSRRGGGRHGDPDAISGVYWPAGCCEAPPRPLIRGLPGRPHCLPDSSMLITQCGAVTEGGCPSARRHTEPGGSRTRSPEAAEHGARRQQNTADTTEHPHSEKQTI